MAITRQSKLDDILSWKVNKPTTDAEWAEDVKKETFQIRSKKELNDMKSSLEVKLPKVQEDLDKFDNWPEAVKYELNQQFKEMFKEQDNPLVIEGKTLQQWIDGEFAEQHTTYKWKVAKLEQSVDRIDKELDFRAREIER